MRTLFTLWLTVSVLTAANPSGWSVKARYPLAGTATWDYVTVDSATHRLYVAHETQVNVLDTNSGASLGVVRDTPGVHGVAIANELNRGFTSNGGDDTATIFDLKTFSTIAKIKVGSRPDRIFCDARSKRVFTCNHGSGDMTAIDANTGSVVGLIPIGGGGEQLVPAPDNLVYVANADTSEVLTINPRTLTVEKRFPLGTGQEPHGLAFDPKHHRLFAACRNKIMVVLDSKDGRVVTSLPIGDTVDMAAFDPRTRLVFASNGDGTLSMFRDAGADHFIDAGPVSTGPNAKQMDFDEQTGRVYLPSGTIVTTSSSVDGKPVHAVKEGTFEVLVVSR